MIRKSPKLPLQFPEPKVYKIWILKEAPKAAHKPDLTLPRRDARREKEGPEELEEEGAGEEEAEEEGEPLVK